MSYLLETASFDSVFQLETASQVLGGAGGVSNTQAQNLTNRTKWLKDNKQAVSINLTALSTLIGAADQLPYFTGAGAAALTSLPAYGRALIAAASAPTALAVLGAAPLASPAFTGTPTAVTAAPGTNSIQLATTAYADAAVAAATVGLWDDRGSYDASGNVFPSTGGSGAAGAILKGDIWTISVAGTLGGKAVRVGDTVRAVVNAPGQTAGNWAELQGDLGYVPANVTNNLSDLINIASARSNLGLGTIATQAANAVAIAGGNIDGTILGGTTPSAATVTTLAVNGGSLTTTQATLNVFNAAATTVNAFGAATTISMGAASCTLTVGDGFILAGGTATGTRIGNAPAQKLGFYGAMPVARPAAYTLTYSTKTRTNSNLTAAAVATTAATNITPYGYSQAQADGIVTNLNAAVVDIANIKQVLTQLIADLSSAAGGNGLVG